jgi:CO/xanthine dehydrogenase Mo-binding subunit
VRVSDDLLEPVLDPLAALEPGAPALHDGLTTNLVHHRAFAVQSDGHHITIASGLAALTCGRALSERFAFQCGFPTSVVAIGESYRTGLSDHAHCEV